MLWFNGQTHCGDKHDNTTYVGENFDFLKSKLKLTHSSSSVVRSENTDLCYFKQNVLFLVKLKREFLS